MSWEFSSFLCQLFPLHFENKRFVWCMLSCFYLDRQCLQLPFSWHFFQLFAHLINQQDWFKLNHAHCQKDDNVGSILININNYLCKCEIVLMFYYLTWIQTEIRSLYQGSYLEWAGFEWYSIIIVLVIISLTHDTHDEAGIFCFLDTK